MRGGPVLSTFPDGPCANICLEQFPLCMSLPSASLLPPLVRMLQAKTPVCYVDTNNENLTDSRGKKINWISTGPTEQDVLYGSQEISSTPSGSL